MSKACEGCTCGLADRTVNGETVPIKLRSKQWFNFTDPAAMDNSALYLERYTNYGLTGPELIEENRPIIGIAQTGSDLAPCNKYHQELAKRIRDGIIAAGGTPLEFPCHPIQESGKRPTASLDRNLSYLSLVEVLFGYPLDGVVLLTGCDKTTPALLMAAATVNIPAIAFNVGPMLNGFRRGALLGSGTVIWKCRERFAQGEIDQDQFMLEVAAATPSHGHCNTMGTASTMNALAEALGMALPGSASIPAVYRERAQCAYATGRKIMELVRKNIKPSDILTREAFLNAIAANTCIGGSTNAPIHLNAIAKHIGVPLDCDDWEKYGFDLPLLVNIQPAGTYLCEEYHRAGGLPAVIAEMLKAGALPHPEALTVSGKSIGDNCKDEKTWDHSVIFPFDKPMKKQAGFLNMKGNLFDSAIMKTSVIDDAFRKRFLSDPSDPNAFEGPVAVFDGPEDFHARVDSHPDIGADTLLVMRGTGPIGYPGAAEVVNMRSPAALLKQNISLPCIGDGRQSGTSGTPSILNASPEAATGGGLSILKDGDRIRVDLNKRTANVLISEEELGHRRKTMPFRYPESQTPWQEIYRKEVSELSEGMVLKNAVKYQRIVEKFGQPRHSH